MGPESGGNGAMGAGGYTFGRPKPASNVCDPASRWDTFDINNVRAAARRRRYCFGTVSTLACRGRDPPRSGGRARAARPEGGEADRRIPNVHDPARGWQTADDD